MDEVDLELTERLLQAHESFSQGNLDLASEICKQILVDCPNNAAVLQLLGIVDYHSQRFEEAALKVFKAIQNDPQNACFFYNLGSILKAQGNLEEAFNFFQNALALKSNPQNINEKPQNQLMRQNGLAVEAYAHSISSGQDPSYLAFHFYKEGQLQEAEYVYNQILKDFPKNDRAQNDLGNVLFEMDRLEEAINCFRKAMETNPNLDQAPYNLANVLSEFGQTNESIKLYRRAIEINPNFFEAYFNLGLVLESLEFFDQAADCFRQATKINPKYVKGHFKAAGALQQLEDFSQAFDEYERAIKLDPNYAEAQYYFADLLKSQGDIEKAVELSANAFAFGQEDRMFEGNIILEIPDNNASRLDKEKLNIATTKDNFLANALTGKTPETAPLDYVRHFFDEFSKRFENHLLENLLYKAPRLMRIACDTVLPEDQRFKNALDLGCGTGLSGESFVSMVDRLMGVDLSPKMIEKSKDKKIYYALYENDILKFLSESSGKFDLVIAADVLIYLGDPTPLFERLQNVLEHQAIFVVSTESGDKDGYHIRQTGRYAHSNLFMESVAKRQGFELLLRESVGLRKEKEKWVDGDIFVFKYLK